MVQVLGAAKTVEDLINDPDFNINDYEGYIYMTTFLDNGKIYIGKKNFFHTTNKKLGKKEISELPVTRGKKPTKKSVIKESDWKTYYGSAKEIKEYVSKFPPYNIIRSVLKLCKTKRGLTYWETKMLFQYNVLENDRYINNNILGKFFRGDLS